MSIDQRHKILHVLFVRDWCRQSRVSSLTTSVLLPGIKIEIRNISQKRIRFGSIKCHRRFIFSGQKLSTAIKSVLQYNLKLSVTSWGSGSLVTIWNLFNSKKVKTCIDIKTIVKMERFCSQVTEKAWLNDGSLVF